MGLNPELLKLARANVTRDLEKGAFTDPATAMGGAGAGAADPMAMTGGDPMAAAGGGDPMAGAMPPMPVMGADLAAAPAPAEAAGGVTADEVRSIVEQVMANSGGAGGAGDAAIKPKIDVNVEIMQMKNMLAKLLDEQGIPMPVQEMVATPDKLQAMASGEAGPGGPAGGSGIESSIKPIEGIEGAGPAMGMGGGEPKAASVLDEALGQGREFSSQESPGQMESTASALAAQIRAATSNAA